MLPDATFTFQSARSATITVGLTLAVVVETLVVHLWLRARYPAIAATLVALSALTIVWLAIEFRAWGRDRFRVGPTHVALRVIGRAFVTVPRAALTVVRTPTWRDVPEAGAPGYLNLTAPAEPNVLLVASQPTEVRLLGGLFTRAVTTIGVHVDDPHGFADAVTVP